MLGRRKFLSLVKQAFISSIHAKHCQTITLHHSCWYHTSRVRGDRGAIQKWRADVALCLAHPAGNESAATTTDACELTTDGTRLKCDREDPCANCVARRIDCLYSSLPRARAARSRREGDSQLAERIRHLEQLVNTIVTDGPATRSGSAGQGRENTSPTISAGAQSNSTDSAGSNLKPGQVIRTENETIYVSSTHWSSLCAEVRRTIFTASIQSLTGVKVADIRDQLDGANAKEPDSPRDQDLVEAGGPMLLDGRQETFDLQTVLLDLPERQAVDRLVYRYFNSAEITIGECEHVCASLRS